MKSSQIIAVFLAILSVLWIGSGFVLGTGSAASQDIEQAQEDNTPLVQVRTRLIDAKPFQDKVAITGRSQASRMVRLRAETTGQISAILKQEGENIAEGEILAELDVRDREARLSEARQRVKQREIEYNAASKLANKGFNSKVRLAQAKADLEDAKAALKDAQIDLGNIKISAPFEGLIFEQAVEAGDYLSVGDELFTLVDLDPIEFVAFVSEHRVQDLEMGAQALVAFLNGQTLEAQISYIAPAADEVARTFRVIVSAPNPQNSVKDGLTAKVVIPTAKKQAHQISPSILTLNDEGKIGVKIVNDQQQVEFMPVQILSDTASSMWVMGLPSKVNVITVGQDFVISGQRVEAVPALGEGLL